jgi:hypothetical protein
MDDGIRKGAAYMRGDQIGDDGLTLEERAGRERRGVDEEASIQVYLDADWYWEGQRLMHPTDRTLTIRIDPVTRDWYPAARIGMLMDKVVKREGRDNGLFEDDMYPTVKLSRLMVEEMVRAKRGDER